MPGAARRILGRGRSVWRDLLCEPDLASRCSGRTVGRSPITHCGFSGRANAARATSTMRNTGNARGVHERVSRERFPCRGTRPARRRDRSRADGSGAGPRAGVEARVRTREGERCRAAGLRNGNDLGGRVLSRMAVAGPPRRAERDGVTSVTRSGRAVGRFTRPVPRGFRTVTGAVHRRGADAGAAPRSLGGTVLSAANRVGSGGFSRSPESPSKVQGSTSGPSKLCTLRIEDTPGSDFREFVVG